MYLIQKKQTRWYARATVIVYFTKKIKSDGSEPTIMRRISKCVDTIRYGYEVDEDE